MKKIDSTKATGSDGLPGFLLKACSDLLTPSLTRLFNMSFRSGVFPDNMKLAHVCPLFKGGDSTIPTNYRPVSLLSIVSKMLERVAHEQLIVYLNKWNVLPEVQYAYRKGRSTEDALVLATDRLLSARDAGLYAASVFLDLSKAFDKVQHNTLVSLLYDIGISGTALQWFISYLSNRRQVVVVGNTKSKTVSTSCGVPQGSVLGPVLFSLYVKDLPLVLPKPVNILQFADDIMLSSADQSTQCLEQIMSRAVSDVASWLQKKGLILNARKSQVLLTSPRNSSNSSSLSISCHGTTLPSVQSAKYLGLEISENLTWEKHVDGIAQKAAKKIGALARAKNSLTEHARYKFYSAVIQTDLLYASNAFSSSLSNMCCDRMLKLQKKGMRAIYGWPPWAHTLPIFNRFHEQSIKEKMLRKLPLLVWRCANDKASEHLKNLFNFSRPSLQSTRGSLSQSIVLPLCKTTSGINRPSFVASVTWNGLSPCSRNAKNKQDFLSSLPQSLQQ